MLEADRVILDLRGLEFIDSSGLRMILRTWERARSEGFELEIVRGSEHVDKLVRTTGLDSRLPMVDAANGSEHSTPL
jgi:anti-anti-sigma factor